MKTIILLHLFLISVLLPGQTVITGTVYDTGNHEALSYVNIGIKSKSVGVISSDLGTFSLLIPEKNQSDTLTFSRVGYQELSVPIAKIIASEQRGFSLKAKTVALTQVDITAKKLKENKYGIKKQNPKLHFVDASINQTDVFEIAQVITLGNKLSKITSVNLLINQSNPDSGTFRINFYKFDGSTPTERLIEIPIIEKRKINGGWMSFDLNKHAIYLKGRVTVAIEFIPTEKNNKPVYYEVKLGGTSESFVRSSSLGSWNRPPHHYRMYVTALESDTKKVTDEDPEEKETQATLRLFSKEVSDTFSLFIRLPKNYVKNKGKQYPVLFLLDANIYYDQVSAIIEKLNGGGTLTEPIVVGIGYRNIMEDDSLRDRDYTYPKALPSDSFAVSGGADKFLRFIEKELGPYLDSHYRTDTNARAIMGHSLGGYFCLYALQRQQEENGRFFNMFISASPSLHYGNGFLLSQFRALPGSVIHPQSSLLITTGELELREDSGTLFNAFTELLSKPTFKPMILRKLIFPKTDHMDAALPGFDKGMELIMNKDRGLNQ